MPATLTILALGLTHLAAFLAGAWVLYRGRINAPPVAFRLPQRVRVARPSGEEDKPHTILRAPAPPRP